MKKNNIEQIVRELFRENYYANELAYELHDGLITNESSELAQDVAIQYYDNRTELDQERDEQAGVTKIDYVEWVMAELSNLIHLAH